MATTPEEATSGGLGRRQLGLIAGIVLVLLFLVWFLFLRGGGEPQVEEAAPAPAPEAAPETPQPSPSEPDRAGGGGGGVETFEVFAARDPFDPLISAGSGTTTGGATTGGTQIGGATNTGGGTTGQSDPNGGTAGASSVGGHRVKVVDVYRAQGGPRAQVAVDGTVYTADEGERFADSFQLLSAAGECATMLFGDDQFTLCEGEEILK
jgi:hypothetical protein